MIPAVHPSVIPGTEGAQRLQWVFDSDDFDAHSKAENVPSYAVNLKAGDMYFFKSDSMHSVPGFGGDRNRITLATFIGVSEEGKEVSVWS